MPTLAALAALAAALSAGALARCIPVAQGPGSPGAIIPVAAEPRGPAIPALHTEITFLGHASFLIRTHKNITAVTDYNGYVRAPFAPDIVTMNRAHGTHYTDTVEPGVKHALKGWVENGVIPRHDVTLEDLRVTNVPTNIRDGEALPSGFAGNSIFIFESAGLCIAHLGHLHHRLKPSHAGRLGTVDVMLAPIDDVWTIPHRVLVQVIDDLKPVVVIPMHYGYQQATLDRFLALMKERNYAASILNKRSVQFAKATLPAVPTVVVLEGNGY